VTLPDLAATIGFAVPEIQAWQSRGEFPQPTYVSEDGSEWYTPALARLTRRCRREGTDLRTLFYREFGAALRELRRRDRALYGVVVGQTAAHAGEHQVVASEYWAGLLSGQYGACLSVPWVPEMIRKERLLARIGALTADPKPTQSRWNRSLRRAVDDLERLEMPFADWDRTRFGKPVTRDTHIDRPRRKYPRAFSPRAPGPAVRPARSGGSALAPSPDPDAVPRPRGAVGTRRRAAVVRRV
jgi:hypothetical protein